MKKKGILLAFLMTAVMAVFTLGGCGGGDEGGGDEGSGGDTIKVGGTFTTTGDLAHSGSLALEGAQAAVTYVNEELGGVNGKQVELVYYDDEFDSGKIPSLYEKLINTDNVDLLVSPYTSALLDAAPTVDQYGKIMFSVAADSYEANETYGQAVANIQMDEEWKGGMWWKDVFEFIAAYDDWGPSTNAEKPKTIAMVNLETTYGNEVSAALHPFLEEHGIEIVYEEQFAPGTSDWTSTVTKIKQLNPDIVFNDQYFDDGVNFIQTCKKLNYSAPYMIVEAQGWDAMDWTRPETGGLDPQDAKKSYLSYSVYKPTREAASTKWLGEYCKEKYDSIPGNDIICGFMAVELACKAANDAGSCEKDALIDALTKNTYELAGYDYQMNETGGNAAEFTWSVGQYQPVEGEELNTSADDWQILWPSDLKTADPVLPFQGWD